MRDYLAVLVRLFENRFHTASLRGQSLFVKYCNYFLRNEERESISEWPAGEKKKPCHEQRIFPKVEEECCGD